MSGHYGLFDIMCSWSGEREFDLDPVFVKQWRKNMYQFPFTDHQYAVAYVIQERDAELNLLCDKQLVTTNRVVYTNSLAGHPVD